MPPDVRIRIQEGSNPPHFSGIQETGPLHWTIFPWQEYPEGTRVGKYHFRLDLCVENRASSPRTIFLDIHWPHAPKLVSQILDFVYVLGPGRAVRHVPGKTLRSVTRVRTVLQPGRSWISTNPAWHCRDNDAWLGRLRQAGAKIRTLGRTPSGRAVRAVEFGAGPKTALIAARMHPYESASSYCAAGAAEWLAKASPAARALQRDWRFSIVPVANPDGVAAGCTRLTGEQGADLNIEALEAGDGTALVLKKWIDRLKPDLFVNFHNWMGKTTNGLFYLSKPDLWAYLEAFDDMFWEKRTWLPLPIGGDVKPGDPVRQTFDRYCHEVHGALSYILEFPWHGSTPGSIRRSGVKALRAAVQAFERRRADQATCRCKI